MRKYLPILVALTALATFGCGDSDSGTSPTPTTSVGPSAANISGTVTNVGVLGTGSGNIVVFDLTLTESAGVGANINFIRLEVFRATGEFEERQEIGSGAITAQTGSNRLDASGTRVFNVGFAFNATIKTGRVMRVTVGLTDDRGNNSDLAIDFVFSG